jgi:hypothetical protein
VYSFYPSPQIQAIAKANHLVGLAGRLACGPICWLACWLAWGCKPYEPSKPWLLSLLSLRERKRERERERECRRQKVGEGNWASFGHPKEAVFRSFSVADRPKCCKQTNNLKPCGSSKLRLRNYYDFQYHICETSESDLSLQTSAV